MHRGVMRESLRMGFTKAIRNQRITVVLKIFHLTYSPDSWKLWGFLLLKDWVADPHNRQMVVMPLPPCLPSFVSLHDLHSGLLLAAPAALSPFICLVTLHGLSFVSQCWFLCPPPPASPFIAFHLPPSFFGNAIWGLCRCNVFFFSSRFLWHISFRRGEVNAWGYV